jgi:phosphatidylserine/phosphatidylglycerophosphate/cardiolipin synthase-like enzyme
VVNPFTELVAESRRIYVAAPFVTKTEDLLDAAKKGKQVDLLVGLNAATSPEALSAVHEESNVEVRYYTNLFHGKVYLFDKAALVGSSNLTDGGMRFNREATIRLDEPDDVETIEELRALFAELWDSAPVLTTERLKCFTDAYERFKPAGNPDALIGDAVGRAEPQV